MSEEEPGRLAFSLRERVGAVACGEELFQPDPGQNDVAGGFEVKRRVRQLGSRICGSIGINSYVNDPVSPFGGVKASGLGREMGPEGLAGYQVLKSIYQAP